MYPISFSSPWYLLLLLALVPVVWLWWTSGRTTRRGRGIASLVLRAAILFAIVLSLSGLQWVRASDELAVVFLLDASDSIDAAARERAMAFLRTALAEMGPDDRAALVVFGENALVEWPLFREWELDADDVLQSVPRTAHTDLGEAIRLGLALVPATAQRRLVILSDGQANVPGAEAAAALAAAGGVELDVVPLYRQDVGTGEGLVEAWVDALDVPASLYEGEEFSLVVRVRSTADGPALLRVYAPDPTALGDRLVAERAVYLQVGSNAYLFPLTAGRPGYSAFRVQLLPERDTFHQNNALSAFAVVHGAPRVLVVARPEFVDEESGRSIDEAAHLIRALESAGLRVERITPAYLPVDLASAGDYASIVLVNVPASALSPRQMSVLQASVRDLGGGMVAVGGEDSYGVGGYYKTALEETLPVEMTLRDKERMPPVAIAYVIDKSGSMDVAARQGGARKIDLAKEAIIRSLELLQPGDQLGVIAFESTAQWVYPSPSSGQDASLAEMTDLAAVQDQVATIRAAGGTDIYAGLSAAVAAMGRSDAQIKHVLLLTDGGASQMGLGDLAARLREAGGTLSAVGIGQDAAPFLEPLALDSGGRYHYVDDPAMIPLIFTQETALAQRAYIVEEPFYPAQTGHSPILEGIDAVPALYGYVATSIKPTARMVLASGMDDPLLAQWQYGLGRAVAWTSDATTKWAREWVRWEEYPRFWAQAVRWTILDRDPSALEAQFVDEGEQVRVVVDVGDEGGEYGDDAVVTAHLLPPSMVYGTEGAQARELTLRQTAPGRYEGVFTPEEEGAYLMRVAARPPSDSPPEGGQDVQERTLLTGYVQPYSPEYRAFGTDEATLRRLAEIGGGRVAEDADLADPSWVYAHDQDAVRAHTPVWPWLLGLAVCLLPLDVGVRRLAIDGRDVRRASARARAWVRGLFPSRQPVAETQPSEEMERLMRAKERAPVAPPRPETIGVEEDGDVPRVGDGGLDAHFVEAAPEPAAEALSEHARPMDETPSPPGDAAAAEPDGAEGDSLAARLLAARRRARGEQPDE
jgi:Mg-chelatase subunit ChlD